MTNSQMRAVLDDEVMFMVARRAWRPGVYGYITDVAAAEACSRASWFAAAVRQAVLHPRTLTATQVDQLARDHLHVPHLTEALP